MCKFDLDRTRAAVRSLIRFRSGGRSGLFWVRIGSRSLSQLRATDDEIRGFSYHLIQLHEAGNLLLYPLAFAMQKIAQPLKVHDCVVQLIERAVGNTLDDRIYLR